MSARLGVCEVCRAVKGDTTPKAVLHCDLCDADLCADCRGRYDLRAVAAFKRVWSTFLDTAMVA